MTYACTSVYEFVDIRHNQIKPTNQGGGADWHVVPLRETAKNQQQRHIP